MTQRTGRDDPMRRAAVIVNGRRQGRGRWLPVSLVALLVLGWSGPVLAEEEEDPDLTPQGEKIQTLSKEEIEAMKQELMRRLEERKRKQKEQAEKARQQAERMTGEQKQTPAPPDRRAEPRRPARREPTPTRPSRSAPNGGQPHPPLRNGELIIPAYPEGVNPWEADPEFRPFFFDFSDYSLQDIVEDWGRMSGLAIIGLDQVPQQKITYHSQRYMNFYESLEVLNTLLAEHGLTLIRTEQHFVVAPLSIIRALVPPERTFASRAAFEAANVPDPEFVTLTFLPPPGITPDEVEDYLGSYLPDYVLMSVRDPMTGRMIMTATAKDVRRLMYFLDHLPRPGEGQRVLPVHYLQLEYTKPSDMAQWLSQLVEADGRTGGQRPPRRPSRTPTAPETDFDIVEFVPLDDTGTLVVRATATRFAEIQQIVEQIEARFAQQPEFEPTIIRLQYVDAQEMVNLVTAALGYGGASSPAPQPARRPRRGRRNVPRPPTPGGATPAAGTDVTVLAEPTSNSLIVIAPDEEVERIREFVAKFDVPDSGNQFARVDLQHVRADQVVMVLTGSRGQRGQQPAGPQGELNVVADPSGAAVYLTGAPQAIEQARHIIAQMDTPAAVENELRIVPLENLEPNQISQVLTMAFADPAAGKGAGSNIRFVPNDASHSLICLAPSNRWEEIQRLIDELEQAATSETVLRTFRLRHLDAMTLRSTLLELYGPQTPGRRVPRRPTRPGRQPQGTTGAARAGEVTISAEPQANLLIVQADPATMEEIAATIEQLESEAGEAGQETAIVAIHHATPREVLETLQTLYAAQPGPKGGRSAGGATFSQVGNSIVVKAAPEQMPEIRGLIEQLDREDGAGLVIRSYDLPDADAHAVRASLEMLFGPGRGIKKPGDLVPTFVADPPHRVIVSAPVELIGQIEEAIEQFRGRSQAGMAYRSFRLEYASAASIVDTLKPLLQARAKQLEGATGKPAPGGPSVEVQADPRNDRVFVAAPAEVMEYAEQLVSELDEPTPQDVEPLVLRIVELQNATAEDMLKSLTQMMQGSAEEAAKPTAGVDRRTGQYRIGVGHLRGQVNMTVAPGSQALVLRGLKEDVDKIEEFIRTIDGASKGGDRVLKRYQIGWMDVDQLARMIVAMTTDRPTGKFPWTEDPSFAGPYVTRDLAIFTDWYTGQMLVSASPGRAAEVDALVQTLRESAQVASEEAPAGGPLHLVEVFNRDPYDVAYTMDEIIRDTYGERGPKVKVIPGTSSLVISGKPDEIRQIEEMIRKIDGKPRPREQTVTVRTVKQPIDLNLLVEALRAQSPDVDIEVVTTGATEGSYGVERVRPGGGSKFAAPAVLQRLLSEARVLLTTAPESREHADGASPSTQPASARRPEGQAEAASASAAEPSQGAPPSGAGAEGASQAPSRPKVRIVVDPATGTIRFLGDREAVMALEEQLDELLEELSDVTARPDIRVFRLRYVDVNFAAAVLERVFNEPRRPTPQRTPTRAGQQQAQRGARPGARGEAETGREALEAELGSRLGGARRGEELEPEEREREGREAGRQPGQRAPTPPTPQIPTTGNIRVIPDPSRRWLIIRAASRDFPVIEELLATIDQPASEDRETRIFPLKVLNAEDVEATLKATLGLDQAGRRTPPPRAAGARTAGGLPTAVPSEVELVEGEEGAEEAIVFAHELTITSNAATNTIIARGTTKALDYVAKLIADLEAEISEEDEVVIERYPLQHANAADLVPQLEAIFAAPTRRAARGRGARGGDAREQAIELTDVGQVVFTADERTNTIIVKALRRDQQEIADVIAKLDTPQTTGPRRIPVRLGNPSIIAERLKELFVSSGRAGGRVTIVPDTASGQIIVTGASDALFQEIFQVATDLDVPMRNTSIRVYPLQHAYAKESLENFKDLVSQLMRQATMAGAVQELDTFAATADERTNSLVVVGGPTTFMFVEQVLEQIDVPPKDPTQITTAMFALTKSSAAEVARQINNLFAGEKRKSGVEPPRAEPNLSTNTVLVRGTKRQIEEIQKQIIDRLEEFVAPAGTALKDYTFKLEHAKADEVAQTLQQYFERKRQAFEQANIKGVRGVEHAVSIVPDLNSNTLFVVANEANRQEIERILGELDREGVSSQVRRTEIFQLRFAEPGQTANAINNAFAVSGRVPEHRRVTAVPEYGTRSVIVSASPDNMERVRALIEKLDDEKVAQSQVTEIIRLQEARADEVARIINQTVAQTRRRTTFGQLPISVVPSGDTNSLIVAASARDLEWLRPLIQQLDVPPELQQDRVVETYQLQYSDPGSVRWSIQEAFNVQGRTSPREVVQVGIDWGTSTLIVAATPERQEQVRSLIEKLDRDPGTQRGTRLIKLKEARAADVANTINQVVRQSRRGTRQGFPITIVADEPTNSLVVSAQPSDFNWISDLVESLDVPQDVALQRTIEVYQLKYADPGSVRWAVFDSFNPTRGRGQNPRDLVQVNVDWGTRSLIVSASPENQKRVAALIEKLDQETEGQRVTETIPVVSANARELANALNQMVRSTRQRNVRGQMPVAIVADTSQNKLIVNGTRKEIDEIKALVADLDKPAQVAEKAIRVINLQFIDADEVRQVLEDYLRAPGGRGNQLTGNVRVSASTSANAVVLTGPQEMLDQIEPLIRQLDSETTRDIYEPRFVKLEHASASQVASTIRQIFEPEGEARGRGGRGQRGSRAEDVPVVIADEATNTLIVRAKQNDFNLIRSLVAELDTPQGRGPGGVRVIPVAEGLRAADIAAEIEETINRGQQMQAQLTGARPELVKIGVIERTNVLLVSGSPAQFAEVEKLVRQLEQMRPAGGEKFKLIKLRNISSDRMKQVLEEFVQEQEQARRRTGGRPARRPRRR